MKIKSFFLSLLLLSGMLFISCEQTELSSETELPQLAERVAADANFQKVQDLSVPVSEEETTISIIDLEAATIQLIANFPELPKLEKEVLKEVFASASNIYSNHNSESSFKVSSCNSCLSSCSAAQSNCSNDTYCDYLISFYRCKTQPCRDFATEVYNEAIDLCDSWYEDCWSGCPCW